MGTPTKLIENLVPVKRIEEEDLIVHLELVREMLKPHLKNFTLATLGEVECLKSDTHEHRISFDNPALMSGSDYTLDAQGIFGHQFHSMKRIPDSGFCPWHETHCPNGSLFVWGLTRSGDWITAEVHFEGTAGYKDRGYQKAYGIEIKKVPLKQLLYKACVVPKQVSHKLNTEVVYWYASRKRLLEQADEVMESMKLASFLIDFQNTRQL